MDERRLGERAGNRLARMQRAVRVLEDELRHEAALARAERGQRRTVERERAAGDGLEPGERAQQGRFARSRFAHDAERAARRKRERHAAHDLAPSEPHDKILRLDHGGARIGRAARRRRV